MRVPEACLQVAGARVYPGPYIKMERGGVSRGL